MFGSSRTAFHFSQWWSVQLYPSSIFHYIQRTLHSTKKPVTTMLTYPWKCTVLHCNHLGNTWKPLVLMTRHFDYCPIASEGDNQSVRSSAPVVSRCFLGGYNVKLYISRGRLAWWLLAFLHSVILCCSDQKLQCLKCQGHIFPYSTLDFSAVDSASCISHIISTSYTSSKLHKLCNYVKSCNYEPFPK